ncbi:hypothetical protein B0H12DRAFT_576765 [Mycena haematopus]|nr:hypothetical protein B0H12DRAFT_576765 [Mycena haematopus]
MSSVDHKLHRVHLLFYLRQRQWTPLSIVFAMVVIYTCNGCTYILVCGLFSFHHPTARCCSTTSRSLLLES